MGLFDQVLGAIANPNQQASPDQLGTILGTVQQLSNSRGMDAATTQTVLSTVGSYVRSSLQQQRQTQGNSQVEQIVNHFGGTQPNQDAVQAVFSPHQQSQVIEAVAQRTGINPQMIQTLLPILVPLVLNFLKTGAGRSSAPTAGSRPTAGSQSNSVLNSFLDADGDGDVDMGDAMQMAGRYMNQPR